MFQGYWAYAPGTTDMAMADGHPEVQENWRKAIESCKDLPRFYDRVGIEVEGPEWRDATVEEIADTPTVVVADDRGPIPGMEIYDPLSDDFRGATTPDRGRKRARGRGSVGAAVVADTP
jgi:S-DNA-T family DNA segregation ATPase FtsK/SpoIIIE